MIKQDEVFIQVVDASDERARSIPRSPDPSAANGDQMRPLPIAADPTPLPQAHAVPLQLAPAAGKPKKRH